MQLVATGTNGGAQEHVAALLAGLDRTRYDVRVISLSEGSAVSLWRRAGVSVDIITASDEASLVTEVAERLASWRTQVLHGHMYRAEVVGTRAAIRLEGLGLPRPYVVNHIHSSRTRSVQDRETLRSLDPFMDRLVAVSRAVLAKVADERPGRPPVELIHNGVDPRRFHPETARAPIAAEYGLPETVPLVGCVARLEPEKGHVTLLDAWPRVLDVVPSARLLIVGEGSCREKLHSQAEALGLLGGGVIFTGRRDDMPAVTAALDVSVLPSDREAQGLVILEAMASARPVVATRVGGIPEMIEDGVTGLLVPAGDPAALAGAILRPLQDRRLARRLGRAGRELVEGRFRVDRMLSDIGSIYREGVVIWEQRERASAGGRVTAPATRVTGSEAAA